MRCHLNTTNHKQHHEEPTHLNTLQQHNSLSNNLQKRGSLEWDGHLLLDSAGVVDVAGDVEELGARVTRPAEAGEPGAAATADRLTEQGDRRLWHWRLF